MRKGLKRCILILMVLLTLSGCTKPYTVSTNIHLDDPRLFSGTVNTLIVLPKENTALTLAQIDTLVKTYVFNTDVLLPKYYSSEESTDGFELSYSYPFKDIADFQLFLSEVSNTEKFLETDVDSAFQVGFLHISGADFSERDFLSPILAKLMASSQLGTDLSLLLSQARVESTLSVLGEPPITWEALIYPRYPAIEKLVVSANVKDNQPQVQLAYRFAPEVPENEITKYYAYLQDIYSRQYINGANQTQFSSSNPATHEYSFQFFADNFSVLNAFLSEIMGGKVSFEQKNANEYIYGQLPPNTLNTLKNAGIDVPGSDEAVSMTLMVVAVDLSQSFLYDLVQQGIVTFSAGYMNQPIDQVFSRTGEIYSVLGSSDSGYTIEGTFSEAFVLFKNPNAITTGGLSNAVMIFAALLLVIPWVMQRVAKGKEEENSRSMTVLLKDPLTWFMVFGSVVLWFGWGWLMNAALSVVGYANTYLSSWFFGAISLNSPFQLLTPGQLGIIQYGSSYYLVVGFWIYAVVFLIGLNALSTIVDRLRTRSYASAETQFRRLLLYVFSWSAILMVWSLIQTLMASARFLANPMDSVDIIYTVAGVPLHFLVGMVLVSVWISGYWRCLMRRFIILGKALWLFLYQVRIAMAIGIVSVILIACIFSVPSLLSSSMSVGQVLLAAVNGASFHVFDAANGSGGLPASISVLELISLHWSVLLIEMILIFLLMLPIHALYTQIADRLNRYWFVGLCALCMTSGIAVLSSLLLPAIHSAYQTIGLQMTSESLISVFVVSYGCMLAMIYLGEHSRFLAKASRWVTPKHDHIAPEVKALEAAESTKEPVALSAEEPETYHISSDEHNS